MRAMLIFWPPWLALAFLFAHGFTGAGWPGAWFMCSLAWMGWSYVLTRQLEGVRLRWSHISGNLDVIGVVTALGSLALFMRYA